MARFSADVNLDAQTITSQKIDGVAGTWLDSITNTYSVSSQKKYDVVFTSAGLTNPPAIILTGLWSSAHHSSVGDGTGVGETAPSNTQFTFVSTSKFGTTTPTVISITLISQD